MNLSREVKNKPVPPSQLGRKRSPETKKRISEAKKLSIRLNPEKYKFIGEYVKKNGSWNRGVKMSDSAKENMRNSQLKYYSEHPERKTKISEDRKDFFANNRHKFKRENSSNWKGGITPLIRQIRKSFEMKKWINDVFTRDGFKCRKCGKTGYLEAHHTGKTFKQIFLECSPKTIEDAIKYLEFWNIDYGITLCKECHKAEHRNK